MSQIKKCPACGYSLRGLPDRHRCPECGLAYDAAIEIFRPVSRLQMIGTPIALAVWILMFAYDVADKGALPDTEIIVSFAKGVIVTFMVLGIWQAWDERHRRIVANEEGLQLLNDNEVWFNLPWSDIKSAEWKRTSGNILICMQDESLNLGSFGSHRRAQDLVATINERVKKRREPSSIIIP